MGSYWSPKQAGQLVWTAPPNADDTAYIQEPDGGNLIAYGDFLESTNSLTYVKLKEIIVRFGGAVLVAIDYRIDTALKNATLQIRKNGVQENGDFGDNGGVMVHQTLLVTVAAGDILTIWMKTDDITANAECEKFRLYAQETKGRKCNVTLD